MTVPTAEPVGDPPQPTRPPHQPPDQGLLAAHWATWLYNTQHGRLTYSEAANRSELFHQKPGVAMPAGVHADCSQMVASCLHWAGVKSVNDKDYTGTLLQKGHLIPLSQATPGCIVIYGGGTGQHTDMLIAPNGKDWWIIGFGHPGGPDHGSLLATSNWFAANGHPGLRILRFT